MKPEENDSKSGLPVFRADVVEAGQPVRAGWEPCVIGEHLQFSAEALQLYCLASWNSVVFDAFVVAAAVEFCDRELRRLPLTWGREFQLRLAVHDPEYWASEPVTSALVDALTFVTGDRWVIEFRGREKEAERPQQCQFTFPPAAKAVIPFSNGLDSYAVASLESLRERETLIHVRVGTRSVDRQRASRGQPFAAVPYKVVSGKRGFRESSARSRGFKFLMIAGIAAHLAKVHQIVLPESGQGALGPALAPVGQAYPDYRNHPAFAQRMERLLSALLQHRPRYVFPRLWQTKGETLREYIRGTGDNERWKNTRSCWQSSRQSGFDGRQRQCGICAACMLRRLSVHTVRQTEARDEYIWENLNAPTFELGVAMGFSKITTALRQYAIAGVLHLDHLAALTHSDMHAGSIRRNIAILSRCMQMTPQDIEVNLSRLLHKHAEEWTDFKNSLDQQSFIWKWLRR